MDKQDIQVIVFGEGSRRTLIAKENPLQLTMLEDCNVLIEPHLLEGMRQWLESVTLEEAAAELEISISLSSVLKRELQRRAENGEDLSSSDWKRKQERSNVNNNRKRD